MRPPMSAGDAIQEGFRALQPASAAGPGRAPALAPAGPFQPPPPLRDPTPEQLSIAFVANLFDLFRATSHLPGGELEEAGAARRHHAFPFNPMFRGAWGTQADTTAVDGAIDETIAWFRARQAPFFFWWVDPRSTPPDLGQRLAARGFAAWETGAPGMVADLSELRYDLMAHVPAGFEIERVADDAGLRAFKDAFVAAYEIPEWAGQAWVDATTAFGIQTAPWRMYVGRLNGKPVATNMLFLGGGVAGVFAVGTLPEARRQGIGAAITLIAYQDARDMGYRHGVLFATESGTPVYQRIGLRATGATIDRYLWRVEPQP